MSDYKTENENDTLHEIDDENNILANSTMLPNIIDDMDLSPYAVRLYFRFKRRVNQNRDGSTKGSAYDSTRTLAESCKMSIAQVTKTKRELVAAGLIRITKIPGKHGEWAKDHVTIIDIWEANKAYYSKNRLSLTLNNGEIPVGKEARALVRVHPSLRAQLPKFIKSVYEEASKN